MWAGCLHGQEDIKPSPASTITRALGIEPHNLFLLSMQGNSNTVEKEDKEFCMHI
jgi:hypothetical protein